VRQRRLSAFLIMKKIGVGMLLLGMRVPACDMDHYLFRGVLRLLKGFSSLNSKQAYRVNIILFEFTGIKGNYIVLTNFHLPSLPTQ
jgi:hypothetical protein